MSEALLLVAEGYEQIAAGIRKMVAAQKDTPKKEEKPVKKAEKKETPVADTPEEEAAPKETAVDRNNLALKMSGKEMEFYRIENSGQLKKGMFFFCSGTGCQTISAFFFCREWGASDLVPGVAFDRNLCIQLFITHASQAGTIGGKLPLYLIKSTRFAWLAALVAEEYYTQNIKSSGSAISA